ncbi:MAG: aminoacyl-tRNA hydrolase [Dehalococcoidales bacterium]|nr:aminoacyl-tRNA hydrolase [Dehalococcoidales bacterium]
MPSEVSNPRGPSRQLKIVVGLGNPGFLYARNRHNLGFMCVNYLAREKRIPFDRKQAHARTGAGIIAGRRVILAKPQTFMNASGESVSALMKKFNLGPEDLIVIHDDLDLPLGKIRLRLGGSSGGHKGIESIIMRTGSPEFYRVRVGIGRPQLSENEDKENAIVSYVLSDFTPEEKKVIDATIPRVAEAVTCLLAEGITAAMNRYNR